MPVHTNDTDNIMGITDITRSDEGLSNFIANYRGGVRDGAAALREN